MVSKVPIHRWIVYLFPALILLGVFRIGYDSDTRIKLVNEWKTGGLQTQYWTKLRLYYSKTYDVLLYYDYASFLLGIGASSESRNRVTVIKPVRSGEIALPYQNFHFEYPPLSLVPMLLPRLVGNSPLAYQRAFAIQITLLLYLIIAAAVWERQRLGDKASFLRLCCEAGVISFLIGPLLIERFDLIPAAIMLLSALALMRRRYAASGFWAGIGAAIKIVPIILLVLPIMGAWKQNGFRAACKVVGSAMIPLAICIPFTLMSPSGFLSMFAHHTARGLQIESSYSLGLFLAHLANLVQLKVVSAGNSDVLTGTTGLTDLLGRLAFPLLAFFLSIVVWRIYNDRRTENDAFWIYATMLLLLTFMFASPIGSPQFAIWLLPLVLIVPGHAGNLVRFAYGLFAVASQIQYNGTYHLLWRVDPVGIAGLALRWVGFGVFFLTVYRLTPFHWRLTTKDLPLHRKANSPEVFRLGH